MTATALIEEFNRYFTSMNGVDVPQRVSVPRDEWRALHDAIKQAPVQDHKWGCRANAFGACTCAAQPTAAPPAAPVQEPVAVPKIEWVNTSSEWVVGYLQAKSIFNAEQIGEMMDFAALAANKFYATPPAAPTVQEPVAWTGCGECDCSFPCHEGRTACMRNVESECASPSLTSGERTEYEARIKRLGEMLTLQHESGERLAAQIMELEEATTPPAAQPAPDLSKLKPENQQQMREWIADGSFAQRAIDTMFELSQEITELKKAQPAVPGGEAFADFVADVTRDIAALDYSGIHGKAGVFCVSADELAEILHSRSESLAPTTPAAPEQPVCWKHGNEPKRGCAWCDKQPPAAQPAVRDLTHDEWDAWKDKWQVMLEREALDDLCAIFATPSAAPVQPVCPACESIEWEGQPCQICQPTPAQPAPVSTDCRHCGGPDNVLCAGQCKQSLEAPVQPVPCVACEGNPKWGNIPCAVCGTTPPAQPATEISSEVQSVQPAPTPEDMVLMPKRMTQAMRDVTDQADWTWEDLLAAAVAITEGEYNEIATAAQPAQKEIEWPKARDVGRLGDMSPVAHLRVGLDSDNDVYVSVWDENGGASIEFCTPGSGGGASSATRMALIALMVAIEQDNTQRPDKDWWSKRMKGGAA